MNVKCHLDHALFMVWLFLWGEKKEKEEARWLEVLLRLHLMALVSERGGRLGQWGRPRRRPGPVWARCGLCSPGLIWAGGGRHRLSFSAARNHACASP